MTNRALGIAIAFLLTATMLFAGLNLSMEVSGAPTKEAPSAPQNLAAESKNNQIKLTWEHPLLDGGSSRLGYVLHRGLNTVDMPVLKSDFGPFVIQYTDSSVTNGQFYYYGISAINDDGVGAMSDIVHVKPVGPSGPPNNFTVSYDSRLVELEWETPENDGGDELIGYRIMKGPIRTQLDTIIDIPIQNNYTDTNVINGVSYYYSIRASNSYVVNGSMPPEPLQVTPRGTPDAPGDLNVTGGDRQVFLNWTYPADDGGGSIIRYNIYRGLSLESVDLYFSPIGLNTDYLDNNITNGETYHYAVSCLNMEGEGEKTEISTIRPLGAPDSPMNLTVSPGDTEAHLSWKEPGNDGGTDLLGYNVYRTTKGVEMTLIEDVGLAMEYTDTNLTNGDLYYYQVRGYNGQGVGLPSKNEEVKPDFSPAAPGNFRTKENEGYLTILWAHPPLSLDYPVTEFKIFKGTMEDDLTFLVSLNATTAKYDDMAVDVGVQYFYMIRSYSKIGEGPESITISGVPYSSPSMVKDPQAESNDGLVTVSWSPPEFSGGREIVNYKIYRGETRDGMAVLVTLPGTASYFNDTNVENGVTYYYSIMPVNEMKDGNLSGPLEAKPLGPPSAPRNLVSSTDVDKIVLEWEQPRTNGGRPITGFIILRGPAKLNLSHYKQVGLVYNYTDTDVEKGVEYFYAIIAVNDVDQGKQSTPSGTEIFLDRDGSEPEQNYTPLIIGGIVLVIIIIVLVVVVIILSKKKQKEEEEGAQEFEESEKEREHRLVMERRKQMQEFTDVALNTEEAHAHDQVEQHLSYEDLYGNQQKEEPVEEVVSGDVTPPEQVQEQPPTPEYQAPPEEEITPQAQPAPPEEPATGDQDQGEQQAEYISPQAE